MWTADQITLANPQTQNTSASQSHDNPSMNQTEAQDKMNEVDISRQFNEMDAMDPSCSMKTRLRASFDAMMDKRTHRKLARSNGIEEEEPETTDSPTMQQQQ
ncbi:hypothetical protein PROFUN_12855 [Planoprotostelium fungivorum]|uniref:Uncharacterized protein n=1 Tax=Planoprotostelium fungivorum TaxID=1890364 RepID=A0A2P6N6C6_9EUKA|nr:hypothetical protein PROFUN_12855 [Planoprotostelium fungivorum]